MKDGDRNLKFFHVVVAKRRSRAIIHRIRISTGVWVDSEADIYSEAISFFQDLFTAESNSVTYDFLDVISKLVIDQDNQLLMEFLTVIEVKRVIFAMDEESSAGADGFMKSFSPSSRSS